MQGNPAFRYKLKVHHRESEPDPPASLAESLGAHMAATTYIARTADGIVSRSSSTRTYVFAVLVVSPRRPSWDAGHNPADLTEGAWGWSGDRVNAEKMAQQARKVYASVRVVPVERIQRTEPAFAAGMPDLAWHTVDETGRVTGYARTKAELLVG
jgi:hypothetical protein